MRLAKIQISLGIRPVWLESSLSAWRKRTAHGFLATHWAQAKTLIRLGGCPGWSESSLGAILSYAGSILNFTALSACSNVQNVRALVVSYVAFVLLLLFFPQLSLFWCIGKAVLPDCGISGVSSFYIIMFALLQTGHLNTFWKPSVVCRSLWTVHNYPTEIWLGAEKRGLR